jgi:cytochrome b
MTVVTGDGRPAPMVRAWDAPTRLFKWTLVALVVSAPLAKNFGDVLLTWHRWNGYAILTLIVWRILWGFAGSTTARFSTFVRPLGALSYARDLVTGRPRRFLGHNPLGGLMVLALMAAVTAQGLAGLFTTDDIVVDGPLVRIASGALVKAASNYHETGFLIVLALAVVHIAANVWYSVVKKDHTIRAMATGVKPAVAYEDAAETQGGSWLAAAICLVVAGAVVFGGIIAVGGRL